MPLQPAYAWSETETSIKIVVENVPIKGSNQLFCSDRVVKLNVPPYLLLLDLKHTVDDGRSTATIIKGRRVVVNLIKAEPGPWHKLTADGNSHDIKLQREESVQRAHAKLLAAQQQRTARKQQEARAAVDLQIQQQKAQRDQLDALKQQELQHERQGLQQWQQQVSQQQQLDAGDESDYEDDTADAEDAQVDSAHDRQQPSTPCNDYHGRGWWPGTATKSSSMADTGSDDSSGNDAATSDALAGDSFSTSNTQHSVAAGGPAKPAAALPFITATPCDTPLLAAVDSADDATEAVMTATSSRRLQGSEASADAACSSGGSMAGGQQHASTTSSKGGDRCAMQPSKPVAPVRSRAATLQVTFTELQTPHLPAREQRELEIKQIKRSAGEQADSMGVADRQPAFLKDKGDALAAQGNYRGAINAYTKALELDPKQAALWANRAAAHLALGQAGECVQDCTTAIQLVQQAHTVLQQAPGSATEQELQAGVLGTAGMLATGTTAAPAAASSEALVATPPRHSVAEDGSTGGGEAAATAAGAAAVVADSVYCNAATSASRSGLQHSTSTVCCSETGHTGAGCSSTVTAVRPADVEAQVADGPPLQQQEEHQPEQQQQQEEQEQHQQQHQQQQQQGDSVAGKLQQLLVKLLARRAAAHVGLQQLQDAQEDLQHALRLDPGNLALQADALEVSLALQPDSSTDHAALRALATARFKAGDMQGAAETFTATIKLLVQQQTYTPQQRDSGGPQQLQAQEAGLAEQRQQQLLLAGALSNRAACWLGLNSYEECVDGCWAAFKALLPSSMAAPQDAAADDIIGTADSSPCSAVTEAPCSSGLGEASGSSSSSSSSSSGSDSDREAVQRLQKHSPMMLLQGTSKAATRTVARCVTRMAAAYRCLKAFQAADAAFSWAAACWKLLGEDGKVAAIQADQDRLHTMHARGSDMQA